MASIYAAHLTRMTDNKSRR